jgi:EmrB/QacA subfamily drug resistance transporter
VTSASTLRERRWLALILLSAAQFVVVLDASIVNVALPSIQNALHFSPENLQWIVNAYTLTFGGFLLLGGRAADLFGRRRVFLGGLVLFSLASLAGGLAQSEGWLIAARAVQGLGAAIISPAALSIVTTTFAEGTERNKALGVWGAVAGAGGAAGVLLGGILTDGLGWEWVLFVNVPIALAAAALTPLLVAESRAPERQGFDVLGAVTVTAGLALLIYSVVGTTEHGWGATRTLVGLALSAVLIAAFLVREATARSPLIRLGILRGRTLASANLVGLFTGGSLFAMFFFISLYLQRVLGYSPLKTGFAYLPLAVTIFLSAGAASALVQRLGVRTVLVTGLLFVTTGLLLFSRVDAGGSYLGDVLAPSVIVAVGLGFSFVSQTLAATNGVRSSEAGLASGLINTSQQVGGALGLAVLSTLATTRTQDVAATGASVPSSLVEGFQLAFLVAAAIAFVGALIALFGIRVQRVPAGEPVPVAA